MLWLEDEVAEALARGEQNFDFGTLDAGVRRVNEQLSHPEQVKRWVVCAHPLTVAAGELTPNLKIRRNKVADARAELVDSLYDGWEAAGGATAQDAAGRAATDQGAAGRAATDQGTTAQPESLHRGEAQ